MTGNNADGPVVQAALASEQKPPPKGRGKAYAALCATCGAAVAGALIGDIRSDEGRELHAYRDIGKIVTICDGDTHNVRMGQVATDGECDERTSTQLLVHARIVIQCVPALREVGHEMQLRAATRMNYNTGAFCKGWFRNRPSPGKLMNAGRFRDGCNEMLQYDLVKGKHIRGLTLRRQREIAICLKGL